ncbi:MAG: ABC transporter permease [Phycisphaerales bacterium]|nr:ABC transporter permease [Phycisphaerales bacterium]
MRRLLAAQELGLVVVLALMMLGLTVFSGSVERRDRTTGETRQANKFFNKENLAVIATTTSFIAIMAVGMTGIIVMGGIDLSIGSIYAIAAVVGAFLLQYLGAQPNPPPGAFVVIAGVLTCSLVGAACGAVNGLATVGLKVHPFIITLGGMAAYRGVAFVMTEGNAIGGFPTSFTTGFFRAEYWGVSIVPLILTIIITLLGAFVLRQMVFGRRVFAIGGNEVAARYAGIPVGRVKVLMFMAAGALAGLSASVMLGYFGSASSDAGSGYELKVIAAAVVGGASLSGGRGSAIGAVLGALIIQVIDNGIIVLGIPSAYTDIVIGVAIVLAVVVDQSKHRLSGRAR